MHAIFHQSCKFEAPGRKIRFIYAGPGPVEVEDWIRETDTYQAAAADGKILEMNNGSGQTVPGDDKVIITRAEYKELLDYRAKAALVGAERSIIPMEPEKPSAIENKEVSGLSDDVEELGKGRKARSKKA